MSGQHPGKKSWHWEGEGRFRDGAGREQVALGNVIRNQGVECVSAVSRLQTLHSGLWADFQPLGGEGRMESEKLGPSHRGTRQNAKPGVRPGTWGLSSRKDGWILHSRVLSQRLFIPVLWL